MHEIVWRDFEKIELRVGTIKTAEAFPEAKKPAYKMTIDFGAEIGVKKSSAQITDLYDPEDLIGKQIIAVVNFPPKTIGPFISECLVTGIIHGEAGVVLAVPDKPTNNGTRLA